MGSIFGGGTTSSTSSSQPWAPQGAALQNAFNQAGNIEQTRLAQGPYTGEQVAGQTQPTTNAINAVQGYLGGPGAGIPGQVAGTAGGLMGAAPQYVSNASQIAANGIGGPNAGLYGTLQALGTGAQTTQGPNAALSSALNNSAVSGAHSLAGFQNGISNVQNQAMSDPTQRTMADAQTYANSPETQAAIQNVNAQIGQTLNEQTVPGLNRQAAMGGSLNSSRAGMAEGMANENAAIAMGNADSQIQNNAFNTGLGTAANQYASGLNTSLNAATSGYNDTANNANTNAALQQALGEFNTGTRLNAANSGLSSQLGFETGNANTQLGANSQLGSATGLGISGAGAAGTDAAQNFALGSGAGATQQAGNQAADTNALQQWQMANGYDQGVLNNYMGVIGANNWGGTSQATQTQPSNIAGGILGTALLGVNGYKQMMGGGSGGAAGAAGGGSGLFSSLGSLFGSGGGDAAAAAIPDAALAFA